MPLRFQTFGQWFVLGKATGKGKEQFWICQCSCNVMAEIHDQALVEGRARSCGCQFPSHRKDLTGQQFGAWLVMTYAGYGGTSQPHWVCQCGCGTRREVIASQLRSGHSTNCGCLRNNAVRHRWYGRLFTLERLAPGVRGGGWRWRCQCTCGAVCMVLSSKLISGQTQSCGCLHRDNNTARVRKWRQQQQERLRMAYPCACCGTTYPRTTEFFPRNGRPQGKEILSPYCKPCARRKQADKAQRRKARLEAQPGLPGSSVTVAVG
jgi:hypothetical protein